MNNITAKCPYCGIDDPREPVERAQEDAPTALLRCRQCGVFFSVFRDDPTVIIMSTAGVYFVECAGFIKIGYSSDWSWRRRAFEAATPLDLTVIGVIPASPDTLHYARMVERSLHARFSHLRHRFEWFRGDAELRDWIARHALDPAPFLREHALAPRRGDEFE